MALFLPGSAHFLSGRRRTGILIYFALLLSVFLSCLPLSVPGVGFFYTTVGFLVVYILLFVGVLISSWRPTRRIGCFGWILLIGAALLLNNAIAYPSALLMKNYVVAGYAMNGAAMSPTLIAPSKFAPEVLRPDRIVVSKWYYRLNNPKRGDIVMFKTNNSQDGTPTNFAMRIVGLPGETIDIESPYVLINGEQLTNPPSLQKLLRNRMASLGIVLFKQWGRVRIKECRCRLHLVLMSIL